MEYAEDVIPVCMECQHTDDTTQMCIRCGIAYCKHFSSEIDYKYCGNCMSDVQLEVSTITKETKYIETSTGIEKSRKRRLATMYEMKGNDWLFAEYQIEQIVDNPAIIDKVIEYHRNLYGMLMSVREDKRIQRLAKLNQTKINLSPLNGSATASPKNRTRVDKITKQVTDPAAQRALIAAALQAVTGKPVTEAQIDAVLAASKK